MLFNFEQFGAKTGEIVAVLKKFEARLEPVRGEQTENAIKAVYRFVARNYPQRQD